MFFIQNFVMFLCWWFQLAIIVLAFLFYQEFQVFAFRVGGANFGARLRGATKLKNVLTCILEMVKRLCFKGVVCLGAC